MSTPDQKTEPRRLRKANELMDVEAITPPDPLFDEFWRAGELALLFGPADVGKSLLAVQIADALARGRPIAGFEMSAARRNVLYVDLVLSDDQWKMRYSVPVRGLRRRAYGFADNFFHDRPPDNEPLTDWLRANIAAEKISVVVIDDLSMIQSCSHGTSEVFMLVRDLRQMARDMGISVLLLADSQPSAPAKSTTERDLRSARAVCPYADSVIALDTCRGDGRHLFQTRARAGEPIWTGRSPLHITLQEGEDGFVGFVRNCLSTEQQQTLTRIKKMRDDGHTFRAIADEMSLSKSTAARLYAKWPLMHNILPHEANARHAGHVSEPVAEANGHRQTRAETYQGEETDNYRGSRRMGRFRRDNWQTGPTAGAAGETLAAAGNGHPRPDASSTGPSPIQNRGP